MDYDIDNVEYAGFWKRFGAMWLDVIILSPWFVLHVWLVDHYRLFNIYNIFITNIIWLYMSVYLVKKFGGSPGKLLMGIRIIKCDGSLVTYKEAFLRCTIDLVLTIALAIGTIYAVLHITDAQYLALNHRAKLKLIREISPYWSCHVHIVSNVWYWSEFIVMLTNKKRRALHDFMAGTVVIVLPKKYRANVAV